MTIFSWRWFTCPTWKKNGIYLRCQKQWKDQKLFLVQILLLTSAVFWENSLTPGIKEPSIFIWIVFETTIVYTGNAENNSKISSRDNFSIVSSKGPWSLLRLWSCCKQDHWWASGHFDPSAGKMSSDLDPVSGFGSGSIFSCVFPPPLSCLEVEQQDAGCGNYPFALLQEQETLG